MPVVVDSIYTETSYVQPSGLNVETTVFEVVGEAKTYILEGYLSLQELQSGDTVTITEYIAVDGTNYQRYLSFTYSGQLAEPIYSFHVKTLPPLVRYRLTVRQTAGTIRKYYYAFTKMTLSVV